MKQFIVEFMGTPGAGKSSICRALNELNISGLGMTALSSHVGLMAKLFRRTRIDYLVSTASLWTKYRDSPYVKSGTLEMYIDALCKAETQIHVERMRRKALVRNLIEHLRIRDGGSGVFVLDEGLAHRGVSALLSGVPRRIIEQHYTYMPLADLYVQVDIDRAIATARLEQRDGNDWRRVKVEDFQHAIERIQQRGRPILRVNGGRSPHETAMTVSREVLAHVNCL